MELFSVFGSFSLHFQWRVWLFWGVFDAVSVSQLAVLLSCFEPIKLEVFLKLSYKFSSFYQFFYHVQQGSASTNHKTDHLYASLLNIIFTVWRRCWWREGRCAESFVFSSWLYNQYLWNFEKKWHVTFLDILLISLSLRLFILGSHIRHCFAFLMPLSVTRLSTMLRLEEYRDIDVSNLVVRPGCYIF